jgi:hypothetical protein
MQNSHASLASSIIVIHRLDSSINTATASSGSGFAAATSSRGKPP